MNKEDTKKAAEVMLAFAQGAEIQHRSRFSDRGWVDGAVHEYGWNWMNWDYRVKPTNDTLPNVIYLTAYGKHTGVTYASESEAVKNVLEGGDVVKYVRAGGL